MTWTEARGRAAVYARSGGLDEILGTVRAGEWSHRLARSHGGTWAPSNGLHTNPAVHDWLHANPGLACEGGWHVRDGVTAPADVPVWLALPWPGWWTLTDEPGDGGPPLLIPAHVDRPQPVMPPNPKDT